MPCRSEQLELVVELAGRRRACLLSQKAALFLPLYQTLVAGRVWKRSSLCSQPWEGAQKREEAATGKQYNSQYMHKTSAATGMVSGFKSKIYKKEETRAFGHQATCYASTALAASRLSLPSVRGVLHPGLELGMLQNITGFGSKIERWGCAETKVIPV